jgi:hypothetical protein
MSSAALFQVLYQNDVLFHVPGEVISHVPDKLVIPETVVVKKEEPVAQPRPEIVKAPVMPASPEPVTAAPSTPEFPKLNHKVLILIDEPRQREMLVSEALFLDNVLKAVGHSSENSDILNFSYLAGPDARNVLSEKRINYFITFGVPLIKLHLDLLLPPYTPKQVEGIWFLLTDPLPVIEADRDLKKKLWTALKQMFPKS